MAFASLKSTRLIISIALSVKYSMMINYNHTVFVFLLLSLGIFKLGSCIDNQSQTNNVTVKCIQSEREALLRFKAGVIDIPGKLSSWVGEDCCQSWKGVECNNESGHVTKLNLSNPAGRPRHFDYYEIYQYYPTKSRANQYDRNGPEDAVCKACLPARRSYDRGSEYGRLLGKITFTLIHLKYLKVFEFLNFLAC